MNKKFPLDGQVIRTAVVRLSDVGYIITADLMKEKEGVSHATVFTWKAGVLSPGDRNYNAHSICIIDNPEIGIVDVSEQGYYAVTIRSGIVCGDIFESSQPISKTNRYGGIRSVSEIFGQAYAVGLRGMVYRLDDLKMWTRIDDGLPDSFNIQAIHGFHASDIYAVGRNGELWHYDGKVWVGHDMPTNANFTSVKCAGDCKVYISGHNGVFVCGIGHMWSVIDHKCTDEDLWDVEWFDGSVYVSSMSSVYRLKDHHLEKVDFGDDTPNSCYQLSAAGGVMWSNGEYDIMTFDGKTWNRVV